ncbi:MAG: hemin uptake protein HemP [Gammaproteobacteria bacterium]
MKPDQPNPDADTMPLPPATPDLSPIPGRKPAAPGIIPADALFHGSQEVLISHNGEHYRLRITRNGKLILTK